MLAAAAVPSCDPDTLNVADWAWLLSTSPVPVPLIAVLWQALQSALLVLLTTRKLPVGSVFCTCGLWQLVHSTFPLTNGTAGLVVVYGLVYKDVCALGNAVKCPFLRTKLTGCIEARLRPNTSEEFIGRLI